MRKKMALLSVLAMSVLPLFAYADITIVNNTDSYGTGKFTYSPCSSVAGDNGVAKPHGPPLSVPQSIINFYCALSSCTAHVYLSQDCSGPEVATATIDKNNGVVDYQNLDPSHYEISGGGSYISIKNKTQGFKSWLNSLF